MTHTTVMRTAEAEAVHSGCSALSSKCVVAGVQRLLALVRCKAGHTVRCIRCYSYSYS